MAAIFQNDLQNIHVSIYQFLNQLEKGPSTKKTITIKQICPLTLMVAIFKNGRRNIHVSISQSLIHVEKKMLVSKHTSSGLMIIKKTIINTQI